MTLLPTEQIGSIPRPAYLIDAFKSDAPQAELDRLFDKASLETIRALELTGSPIISDGEQRKYHSFVSYCVHCAPNIAPDGFAIPFADGHVRCLPRLTEGPFRYRMTAGSFVAKAKQMTEKALKQAVISPSAMSLLYPAEDLRAYSREEFLADLLDEHEKEIRGCFANGAQKIQIDFTEGRLAVKLDPTKALLHDFIDLNNAAIERFSPDERKRLGVHTCPGADVTTHSADVDYAELLPSLVELDVGNLYVAMTGEADPERVLAILSKCLKPGQTVFLGVNNTLDPRISTPEEICDIVMRAARHIPLDQLGTTDDCGFSPFSDSTDSSREVAFAKIKARVEGTHLASQRLGLS